MDDVSDYDEHVLNGTEDLLEYLYEDPTVVYKIFAEIFIVVGLVCAVINILITVVIFKYKRLRKDKANILLAHWCIVNTMFMVSSPMAMKLNLGWLEFGEISSTIFCMIEQCEYTFLFCNILQICLLTFYWYYKQYDQVKFERYTRNSTFFIVLVYVISLFTFALHFDACFNIRFYTASESILFLTYLAFILFTVVINIVSFVKRRGIVDNRKTNVPMIITNTFFCATLPTLIMFFVGATMPIVDIVTISLLSTTLLIGVSNPIYIFLILYKFHDDFRAFFKHVLSCECQKYNDDELDENRVVFSNDIVIDENKC